MVNADTLIAEVRSTLSTYDADGLLDDALLYKAMYDGLRRFGKDVTVDDSEILYVNNRKAILPNNFYSLRAAWLCEPKGCWINDRHKDMLQSEISRREITERGVKWDSCNQCCKEEYEKVITERVYLNGCTAEFYYHRPRLLRLGKSRNKSPYDSRCMNFHEIDNINEIVIDGKMLYANFDSGFVHIDYFGSPEDEDGKPFVPEESTGSLERYIVALMIERSLIKIWYNKKDENIQGIIQHAVQTTALREREARANIKFEKLSPNIFERIKKLNRQNMMRYELLYPRIY